MISIGAFYPGHHPRFKVGVKRVVPQAQAEGPEAVRRIRHPVQEEHAAGRTVGRQLEAPVPVLSALLLICLLYTSDAADDLYTV